MKLDVGSHASIRAHLYMVSLAKREIIEKAVDEMLKAKMTAGLESAQAFPLVIMKKTE